MAPSDETAPDGTLPETADGVLIGARIRARRRELGLTLQAVGERIGVSKSYLGQVETARLTASLNLLERISDVLHVPIRTLIGDSGNAPAELDGSRGHSPETDRRVFLTRVDHRKAVLLPGGRAPLEVLTPDLQRKFEVTQSADPPGDWHQVDRAKVASEEFVHVIAGSYEIEEGGTVHTLHSGDSMVFYPTATYRIRSSGTEIARALWVALPAVT